MELEPGQIRAYALSLQLEHVGENPIWTEAMKWIAEQKDRAEKSAINALRPPQSCPSDAQYHRGVCDAYTNLEAKLLSAIEAELGASFRESQAKAAAGKQDNNNSGEQESGEGRRQRFGDGGAAEGKEPGVRSLSRRFHELSQMQRNGAD